jgi:hypothetical protein
LGDAMAGRHRFDHVLCATTPDGINHQKPMAAKPD